MPKPNETVKYCPICKCKTWHVDGVCEWSDVPLHKKAAVAAPDSEVKR